MHLYVDISTCVVGCEGLFAFLFTPIFLKKNHKFGRQGGDLVIRVGGCVKGAPLDIRKPMLGSTPNQSVAIYFVGEPRT